MKGTILTKTEEKAVAEAVAEAERSTGGEIVTAIIPESDDYAFWELFASVLVGAIVFSALTFFAGAIDRVITTHLWVVEAWMLPVVFGVISMIAGTFFYVLSQIPVIDRIVVPRLVMVDAVGKRSRRHFMESGVYDTVDRTGVLIFISVLERRVELIADRGITTVVSQDRWESIVAELSAGIAAGRTGEALVKAVGSVGEVLSQHVTRRRDDTNELDDGLTTLEPGS